MSRPRLENAATRHPLYSVWRHMLERCIEPRCKAYKNYGGRGIKVSEEWHHIWNFVRDMHPRPDGATLERNDNNGPYSKANCRWATRKEQNRNRRDNSLIEFDGKSMCIAAWAEILRISRGALYRRIELYATQEAISRGGKISQLGLKRPRAKSPACARGHMKINGVCKTCRRINQLVRTGRASLVDATQR